MSEVSSWLAEALGCVLDESAGRFAVESCKEVQDGVNAARFGALMGRAGRVARGAALDLQTLPAPTEGLAGWHVERWSAVDALRVYLVLELAGVDGPSGAAIVEEAFRYADEGELVSLYRGLFLLPEPKRFAWRAGEGARTNMLSVFEAVVCDGPYPVRHFDEVAWKQALLKSLFVGARLASVHGVDSRLSPDVARMALDYADERRSAGRQIPPELWMLLGPHGGQRGIDALIAELASPHQPCRAGAILGLARAGEQARSRAALEGDQSADLQALIGSRFASSSSPSSSAFAELDRLPS